MQRREFIAALGSAAILPLAAGAQQTAPMRSIGVLSGFAEDDPLGQSFIAAFAQGLVKLGWTDGRNIRIDYRWGAGNNEHMRAFASELIALRPDVLFAESTASLAPLRQATRSIPIVFTRVADPIGGGFVQSLARPGGNITGFLVDEPPLASKWVQLLQKMAPGLQRAAYLFNPDVAPHAGEFFRHAEAGAASLMIDMIAAAVRNDTELENAVESLAREPNGGLVVGGDAFTTGPRKTIIALASQHRVPAIYPAEFEAKDGGLISYGIDYPDGYRQAAGYVDRILRGAKPADLPVQAPTKYELVINLKTAKAMGLDVSADMLSIANEVIE
jgi:putative tryptophan/tyrosine transport system substrate-binding protein